MEPVKNLILLLLIITCFFLLGSPATSFAGVESPLNYSQFFKWLEKNKTRFENCKVKKTGANYILCDNTTVPSQLLKDLFSLSPKKLIAKIRAEGVGVEVLCRGLEKERSKQVFGPFCQKATSYPDFDKRDKLEGLYKPQTKTILLASDALKGSLVHEYIHHLQFINPHKIYGHAYKSTRHNIQYGIEKEMDAIVKKSQILARQKGGAKKLTPLLNKMQGLTTKMMGFSFWQDLIDERGIFLLYINFGHEFGATKADIKLARKNMGFICSRKDIGAKLPAPQCRPADLKKFYIAVEEVIQLIRPEPSLKNVDQFLKNLPAPPKGLHKKAGALSKHIFETLKFQPDSSYLSRNQNDNILPDTTLEVKKAHCVGLSTLYLLAAEKWNMQAHLVRIPQHVFVRLCEQKKCVNIETLNSGAITDDNFYFQSKQITKIQAQGPYLDNVSSPSGLKASLYLSLGYVANSSKQTDLAAFFYQKSIDSAPGFPDAYSNLAAIRYQQGQLAEGGRLLSKALRADPNHQMSWLNRALLVRAKDKKFAYEVLDKTEKINPDNPHTLRVKAQWLREDKRPQQELKVRLHLSAIEPKNCQNLERTLGLAKDMGLGKKIKTLKGYQATYCSP